MNDEILLKELRACFDYFNNEVNLDKNSLGYGLVRDKSVGADDVCSIAAVGYGLAALVIGVEHNFISYQDAYLRVVGTLDTFINNVEGLNGIYYHFINMYTGKRCWNSEISIIDTAIFICGVIVVSEYFGGVVKEKCDTLYKRINWGWYKSKKYNYFRIGYKPERGFWGYWDSYAEQLILYVLGCGSPTYPIDSSMYYSLIKNRGEYDEYKDIIYSFYGNLFTYQYSHAWIDFRGIVDREGVNWFDNSCKAVLANKKYCIDNQKNHKTYGENSWGLTAGPSLKGYKRDGAKPCGNVYLKNDGTVCLSGAIASIVFSPEDSISAMKHYYELGLFKEYGFIDSYNLDRGRWCSTGVTGINKGINIIMIDNYLNGMIWDLFMRNEFIKRGLSFLDFRKL